jgi:LysM repeat protein
MFVRVFLIVGIALLVWSAYARPSGAHGDKQVYTVRAYDTLWSIAASQYGGDVRDAIWRIQDRNRLRGTTLHPGQRLVLP